MFAAVAPTDKALPRLAVAFTRNIASLTSQSVLFGMYLVFFSIAFINLARRRRERSCLLLTIASVIMFGLSTYSWATGVSVFVEEVQNVLGGTSGDLTSRIVSTNAKTLKVRYSTDITFAFSYIIGDAVLAWRILVILRWKLLPAAVLIGLWLATTATGLGILGCMAHANWDADLPKLCSQMDNVSWVISLAFNGIATSLLARIAWSHRKVATIISQSYDRKSKVMRVLDILVFSGIIYFLLGVPRLTDFAELTPSAPTTRWAMATQVIEDMLGQLVGLYPTAVTTFLFYESQVFGGDTTVRSSDTRPTFHFARATSHKASDVGGSQGMTMVALSKRQQSSIEDVYAGQV